jgi:hypothetical protein
MGELTRLPVLKTTISETDPWKIDSRSNNWIKLENFGDTTAFNVKFESLEKPTTYGFIKISFDPISVVRSGENKPLLFRVSEFDTFPTEGFRQFLYAKSKDGEPVIEDSVSIELQFWFEDLNGEKHQGSCQLGFERTWYRTRFKLPEVEHSFSGGKPVPRVIKDRPEPYRPPEVIRQKPLRSKGRKKYDSDQRRNCGLR